MWKMREKILKELACAPLERQTQPRSCFGQLLKLDTWKTETLKWNAGKGKEKKERKNKHLLNKDFRVGAVTKAYPNAYYWTGQVGASQVVHIPTTPTAMPLV